MLLTGTFRRSIDDKQRIAIPKRLRAALDPLGQNVPLYLAPGTDGSLGLYTEQAFGALAERLEQASPAGPEVRAFGRLFYAKAQRIELDNQGRFSVPQDLFQLAHLGQEVILVGVRDHVELWNVEQWEKYLSEKEPQYDEIAEKAFGE